MKLGIIMMASGFSRRFGSNKLLYPIAGRPLFVHTLTNLRQLMESLSRDFETRLTVVSSYPEILERAVIEKACAVNNPESGEGISASVRLGVKSLPEDTDYYAFFVADQPYLRPETAEAFIKASIKSGKGIGCVSDGEAAGNPVVFSGKYAPELKKLSGDTGGKQIIRKYPLDTFIYRVDSGELKDIDSPGDLGKPCI
ncbi:MAG: nucleotidyltransferase family protein [Bacillota bacterium]|nr:nucleotidyltransferase family protein [Bacillota bacterium]